MKENIGSPLLSSEERRLFQILHDEHLHDAKTFNKPSYKGIWSGIVDKYKEKAHFVYELLQNADDAQATEASFILEEDRLIFRHNGKVGFSISTEDERINKGHINAIAGVGNSTKNDTSGNTIGKFGVGFKAVFQYTATPHIYDDKFWFRIDDYIVPTLLDEDFPGRKKGETVFVFPFFAPEDAYEEITGRLETLDNPILFLSHLKKVVMCTPDRLDKSYDKTVLESYTHGNIQHDLVELNNYGTKSRLHIFTQPVEITNEGKQFQQHISVGYFLDGEGKLDVSTEKKVFCFFPTAENFKLKCVVHAPFLLVDSRQQLKDHQVNTDLKQLLANLAASALMFLRDYGIKHGSLLIDENVFRLVPEREYAYYSIRNVFRQAYLSELEDSPLFLSRDNKYIKAEDALICRPISMMSILTDEQLTTLKNSFLDDDDEDDNLEKKWYFLREQTQKLYAQDYVEEILDILNIESFDGEDLANGIDENFMKAYGLKWAKRLYTHLKNEQVGLWKRSANTKKEITETPFCLSPIILLSSGEWGPAYLRTGALNAYLPIQNSTEGYNFISEQYDKDEDVLSFFKELGLKEPNAWDYIQSVILSKYNVKNAVFQQSEIVNDFELIYSHVYNSAPFEKQNKIEVLRDTMMLVNTKSQLSKACDLYEDSFFLTAYFKNSEAKFLNSKYYKSFIDKYTIHEFHQFISDLGIISSPRVTAFTRHFESGEARSLGINDYTWSRIEDFKIEGFKEWKPTNIEESKFFWKWFSGIYSNKEYHTAKVSYQYYQVRRKETISSVLAEVKNKAWIITLDGEICRPGNVSLEQLEEAEYPIDYNLIRFFGIEKESKSLEELGASDSQIQQNEIGRIAEGLGLKTEDDLKEAAAALREKREKEHAAKSRTEASAEPASSRETNDKASMRETSLDEMSSSKKEYSGSTKISKSTEEKVQDITQKLTEEANRRIEEEHLRAGVEGLVKYNKDWFSTLLELEYRTRSNDISSGRNQVKIAFTKFQKEAGSAQVYVLSNPSKNIPMWIEEIEGINVKFTFLNKDDVTFTFDVANVKDFTLRLKAKAGDVPYLDKIDWSKCTKASIEVNSPVEVMSRLKTEFANLDYENEFNFRDNLSDNISFVFGPPGTGKTTRLSEIICSKMSRENCRILVLAPTNKACDVLTSKVLSRDENAVSWIGRFVATGDESLEVQGALIDRDSTLWKQDHCCIVSTMARLPYDGFQLEQGKSMPLRNIDWDFVIIDEASMIPLVQIVYAIYKLNKSQIIIAGDPLQIPPIVKEKAWQGENIYTMVNLNNFEMPTTVPIQFDVEKLGTQYRSVPAIGSLYSLYSYDGKLKHNRLSSSLLKLPFGSLGLKPLTFIPFSVERFDSIYGSKKLNGSNVHIYSALLAVETAAYIAKQQESSIKIGVICPYAPQAQLINKMTQQRTDIPDFVDIQCGTIHGFQGDQCEIIITVFNPPTGIKASPDTIMLNNKKVLNVAISRASDYLIVLLPHPDSYGYENLIEINNLCGLAKHIKSDSTIINSDVVEKRMFGSPDYIEKNTFVTTHQLANVYSKAAALYEVRIDDDAVDIQVGGEAYEVKKDHRLADLESSTNTTGQESQIETSKDNVNIDSTAAPTSSSYNSIDESIAELIGKATTNNTTAEGILKNIVKQGSKLAEYVAIQYAGSSVFRKKHNLPLLTKDDIKKALKGLNVQNQRLAPQIHFAYERKMCPLKKFTNIPLAEITYERYCSILEGIETKAAMNVPQQPTKKVKRPRIKVIGGVQTPSTLDRDDSKIYEKFEYGLSDW